MLFYIDKGVTIAMWEMTRYSLFIVHTRGALVRYSTWVHYFKTIQVNTNPSEEYSMSAKKLSGPVCKKKPSSNKIKVKRLR